MLLHADAALGAVGEVGLQLAVGDCEVEGAGCVAGDDVWLE